MLICVWSVSNLDAGSQFDIITREMSVISHDWVDKILRSSFMFNWMMYASVSITTSEQYEEKDNDVLILLAVNKKLSLSDDSVFWTVAALSSWVNTVFETSSKIWEFWFFIDDVNEATATERVSDETSVAFCEIDSQSNCMITVVMIIIISLIMI